MMWIGIFGALMLVMILCVIFLIGRIRKFSLIKKLAGESKKKSWLFGILCLVATGTILTLVLNTINMIIIMIHLAIFFGIMEIIFGIAKKIRKKEFEKYYAGGIAVVVTIGYLICGAYLAYHVDRTDYAIASDKVEEPFRIVQFADSHIGTTFHVEGFKEYVKQMSAENPDVVLITGDFVDDDTTKEDMIGCCAALKDLKTKYGVYYVYGNHDKGYYGDAHRGYGAKELAAELTKNGVTILEDSHVLVDNRVNIIGRQDYSEVERGGSRADLPTLFANVDKSKYCVVMDHQPKDYQLEKDNGANLVLSGHTHGGQMLPVTKVGEWIGANEMTYGFRQDADTSYVVTSGISDWSIKFKTGCKSEYVVIDLKGK